MHRKLGSPGFLSYIHGNINNKNKSYVRFKEKSKIK